jgi:orotate phosphoribosyltransferase
MKSIDINEMLLKADAMKKGHFLLSSGLHSEKYLQCALLLSHPRYAAALCKRLAGRFKSDKIDIVIGPAYGGIIVAYELARALGSRALFAERHNGIMQLRRGFTIESHHRVIIAEDVITTGKSVKEVIACLKPLGAHIVGIASLIDRSTDKGIFEKIKQASVKKINIQTYTPAECPLCKKGIPLTKPGSRAGR